MINIGGGPAFILGVAMILAGVALYAMRSLRPELSRDHDIFFAAIALTSGAILMWQGWRLDPFLFLGYLCAAGSAAFFGVENIRLRGITTEQAKRNTPITDKGRAVSRQYDYEPQDYDYDQDDYRPERGLPSREDRAERQIRATRDGRQGYGGDERRRLRRRDEAPRSASYDDERYASARYAPDSRGRDRYDDERYAPVDDVPPSRKRRLPRTGRGAERPAVRDDWDTPDAAARSGQGPVLTSRPPAPSRDFDDIPPLPKVDRDGSGQGPSKRTGLEGRRPLNVKPAPTGYGTPYSDDPPASSDYADYRPIDDDHPADVEDDNSDYQQPY